jgi:uncharacterized protein YerC
MVQISKQKIPDKILVRIYQLFFEVFLKSRSKDDFMALTDDIFTPTEKIMIAKRIGIIYLLIKGVRQDEISQALKVSSSTVATYSLHFYKLNSKIVEVIKDLLLREKTLGFLEDVFTELFIQPGIKIGHYKLKFEHEKRREERKILS